MGVMCVNVFVRVCGEEGKLGAETRTSLSRHLLKSLFLGSVKPTATLSLLHNSA
jgi:hypothetical protein